MGKLEKLEKRISELEKGPKVEHYPCPSSYQNDDYLRKEFYDFRNLMNQLAETLGFEQSQNGLWKRNS